MRKLKLCIFLIFSLIELHAQKRNFNVRTLLDNPVPFCYLHLIPVYADAYPRNQSLGYGIKWSCLINNRFSTDVKFFQSLGTYKSNNTGEMVPPGFNDKAMFLEIQGRYLSRNNHTRQELDYIISTNSKYTGTSYRGTSRVENYKVTMEYFTHPGLYRRYTAIRFGYDRLQSPLLVANGSINNGTTSMEVNKQGQVAFDHFGSTRNVEVLTSLTMSWINLGISKLWIQNSRVFNETLKKKFRKRENTELFADLLYGKPKFSTVYYSDNNSIPEDQSIWTFNPAKYSPLGWRVGLNWISGIASISAEVGKHPGIKSSGQNMYIQAGIGFAMGFNLSGKNPGNSE